MCPALDPHTLLCLSSCGAGASTDEVFGIFCDVDLTEAIGALRQRGVEWGALAEDSVPQPLLRAGAGAGSSARGAGASAGGGGGARAAASSSWDDTPPDAALDKLLRADGTNAARWRELRATAGLPRVFRNGVGQLVPTLQQAAALADEFLCVLSQGVPAGDPVNMPWCAARRVASLEYLRMWAAQAPDAGAGAGGAGGSCPCGCGGAVAGDRARAVAALRVNAPLQAALAALGFQ